MDFPPTTHTLITLMLFVHLSSPLLSLSSSSSSSSLIKKDTNAFYKCIIYQFKRIKSSWTGVIFTPEDGSSYDSLLRPKNLRPQMTARVKPMMIITPNDEPQIQAAVICSGKLGTQIRTMSGGHDYEGLSYASTTPFVMLDLKNLQSVVVDDETQTAWAEGGATLGQVYHAINKKNKTLGFSAGSCPTVGVGGQISGGGYGMMSRKHGLASNNILDARLIIANGTILDRESMGKDVFWAILGGGGTSYGIVSAFKINLVVVPDTVTVCTATRKSEPAVTWLLYKWQHVASQVHENLSLRLSLRSDRSQKTACQDRTAVATFHVMYLGLVHDLMSQMWWKFPELRLVQRECEEMSWIESVMYFASLGNKSTDALDNRDPQGPYIQSYYKGKSDFVSQPISFEGLNLIWRYLHEEEENRGELELSPCGGVLRDLSDDQSPCPSWSRNLFMMRYGANWFKKGYGVMDTQMDWIKRFHGSMAAYVKTFPRQAYINYRDLDLGMNTQGRNTSVEEAEVWGSKYFGKNNFARLVIAKNQVDPQNVFWNEQSIPPSPLGT